MTPRILCAGLAFSCIATAHSEPFELAQTPIFVNSAVPPLNMLVMGRDHKLYYEAYNDASDLNGDGVIDVGYKGHLKKTEGGIDYYGYFNSHICYNYTAGKFTPSNYTETKTCEGKWSGDFLNYLTTSRMDALRKVLYGGYRAIDTKTETVLQAAFIPQDAHTWGKEYLSESHDGYLISDYTDLQQPVAGYRHLFAVASLTDGGIPQLRTLTHTPFRIWNWVSQERPVAGTQCTNSSGNKVDCTSAKVGDWSIVPAEMLSELTLTTWRDDKPTATNESQMNERFNPSQQSGNLCGSGPFTPPINTPSNFNNPYTGTAHNNCTQNNYHTLIKGKLTPAITGNYEFSVDGDDAVDFIIDHVSRKVIAHRYGDQGASNQGGVGKTGSEYLVAGKTYTIELRHEENAGDASFRLYWKVPTSGTTEMIDKDIRVSVCPNNEKLRESNCVRYANGNYKPTGILHDYGATDKMFFGLLSGSYQNNISGGVLRSQLQSFSKEFNATTGRFCSSAADACSDNDSVTSGIVDTINKFRVIDFNYANQQYGCGWITTKPIDQNDTCYMWGNPIGEMMYETMRYFAGATSPTEDYNYSSGKDSQSPLNLPKVDNWIPPYNTAPQCAVPVMTVISDINPSYDYKLPGSHWDSSVSGTGNPSSISSLNVSVEADKIWKKEGSPSGPFFIGESNGILDGAPTAKAISNFSTIRGLSPEEPTKQGTYYSAAVAHFGANNKIGGDQNLQTYAVALASPLPTFDFPVAGSTVTIVPFAKSVGGDGISATGAFQPTDQIVDFYVETIANTDSSCPTSGLDCDANVNGGRPYAKFRINFEDVEQGADHDMDAIALYEIMVNTDKKLVINMTSEYAAGGIDQHMGYIISGTTKDGIYLEVKDQGGSNISYKLDTPEGKWAGECATGNCGALTRLGSSRTFTVSGGAAANFLENPLWYAAKYGTNASNDTDNDGVPDNYFLVTNALTLKDQLAKAFNDIMQKNASVTQPAVGRAPPGPSVSTDRHLYRTEFDAETWSGKLIKETLNLETNTLEHVWDASISSSGRAVRMANAKGDGLQDFTWTNLNGRSHNGSDLQPSLNQGDDLGQERVNFIKGVSSHSSFRTRDSLLGDIVNSSPVLVAGAHYLPYLADQVDGSSQYRAFAEMQKKRTPMIYVGANDGMLHGFDAETGKETFAFIPTPVIENLHKLTDPNYVDNATDTNRSSHQYYVDGSISVADVYFNGNWRTVLVGTLGAGGRGAFALDVTDPAHIDLLWEFTVDSPDSKEKEGAASDLGHVFGAPVIARLHNGKWGVLLNNGYNSPNVASGNAILFVLNVADGKMEYKLVANSKTGHNGLSAVKAADNNGDGVADYAYAGDLQGNMWRFDLFGTKASGVTDPFLKSKVTAGAKVSYDGKPLYSAKDPIGKDQPITVQPNLIRHPSSRGYIVAFGTGRYLADADKEDHDSLQSVYGIWDSNTLGEQVSITSALTRANLLAQDFTDQLVEQIGNDGKKVSHTIRLLSENEPTWSSVNCQSSLGSHCGWYLDLGIDGSASGERMVDTMEVRGEVLFFSTRQPSDDPCTAGLDAWNYGINPATGGRTKFTVFDLNHNRTVGVEDNYGDDTGSGQVISGYKTPPGGFTLTDNKIINPDGTVTDINLGSSAQGRQSWYIVPTKQAH